MAGGYSKLIIRWQVEICKSDANLAETESTRHHGESLLEQPILPPIPTIVVSNDDGDEGFQAALDALFETYEAGSQFPALLERYKSPSLESVDVSDNSSDFLPPSRQYFSEQGSNDGNTAGEKEYMGYFVLPPRDAKRSSESTSHYESASVDDTHPALRQSSMPSYMMHNYGPYQDAQACLNAFMPSRHDGPFDTRFPADAAKLSRK
jgi:hypothetical protein